MGLFINSSFGVENNSDQVPCIMVLDIAVLGDLGKLV